MPEAELQLSHISNQEIGVSKNPGSPSLSSNSDTQVGSPRPFAPDRLDWESVLGITGARNLVSSRRRPYDFRQGIKPV